MQRNAGSRDQSRRPVHVRCSCIWPQKPLKIGCSCGEIGRAEQHPAEADRLERKKPGQRTRDTPWKQAANRQSQTMENAPENKSPVCSVPQPTKGHRGKQVETGAHLSTAAPTKRDIEIVPQPG